MIEIAALLESMKPLQQHFNMQYYNTLWLTSHPTCCAFKSATPLQLCNNAFKQVPGKHSQEGTAVQNGIIIKLQTQWIYLPPLPLNDCRGERQRNRGERGEKERKVSDNGTVYDVYQVYYNPVLLILNTELNSRDSFNRNLILKVAEYQRTHTYTHLHSRSQPYEIALFDVACNLKHIGGKLYRLRVEAQHEGKRARGRRKREGQGICAKVE